MNYNFTESDIKFVEKAIQLRNSGYYIDGSQLTEVYNRILNKSVNTTNCGSCLRGRITELEGALNEWKRKEVVSSAVESVTEEEPNNTPSKENKELTKADLMKEKEDIKERMARVRSHRKINKQ